MKVRAPVGTPAARFRSIVPIRVAVKDVRTVGRPESCSLNVYRSTQRMDFVAHRCVADSTILDVWSANKKLRI